MKVIIFNGPPGCGKNVAADILLDYGVKNDIPIVHKMFKEKLFKLVIEMFDVEPEEFFKLYNNRETKELSTDLLDGFSPREAMIYVSEKIMKKNFGDSYFGECAAKNLENGAINVFSDGGFVEELYPLYEACDSLLIVRLHRYGCDFSNDSRGYIKEFKDVEIIGIINDFETIDEFSEHLVEKIGFFLA